jgi:TfoX/Sxy family transcriptional regulator of competence genes
MPNDSFPDFLEQFTGLNGLRCKRMFGGYSVYSSEAFFYILLLFNDRLHFKALAFASLNPLYLHDKVFAPLEKSEKQVLNHFRWFWSDILKDAAQLTTWTNAKARP